MDGPSKSDLRRWVEARETAARRERALAREAIPTPTEAFARAMALAAFVRKLHGWPPRETEDDARQDLAGYAAWDRLRARWPAR